MAEQIVSEGAPGPSAEKPARGTLAEIARVFLRLGWIAFGGPAAHIALMEEEFVRRRAWVTRERFLDLVGAVSLLPGPNSTELAIYLGQIRGGCRADGRGGLAIRARGDSRPPRADSCRCGRRPSLSLPRQFHLVDPGRRGCGDGRGRAWLGPIGA